MRRLLATSLSTALVLAVSVAMLPGAAVAKDKGKAACKKGGWKELVRADGTPFADQGECVGYAANGGTPQPPEVIIAIAYSDLNGTPGYQAGTDDVLIAKLVDDDGTPGLNPGDHIIMGRYPTTVDPQGPGDFADWGVSSHEVRHVNTYRPGTADISAVGTGTFLWQINTSLPSEKFGEQHFASSSFLDLRDAGRGHLPINVQTGSSSQPTTPVNSGSYTTLGGDDDYVDVEIY